jgi:alpha-glucosidase
MPNSLPSDRTPPVSPVRPLKVTRTSPSSLSLASKGVCLEITALAEDLFRLRLAKGKHFSQTPSWAVTKTAWPAVEAQWTEGRQEIGLKTTRGRFTLNLTDGAWELRDHFGLVLFSSSPESTGFVGPAPCVALRLEEHEAIFGLGESTGTFNKRGLTREFWNIDVGGHAGTLHAGLPSLYVSIPFAISLRHGRAAGLFWDNPSRQRWDIGQTVFDTWTLSAASGELDLYFFLGPTCPEILERYTELTGRMPLPPKWGLGYQQCRYSYETRQRVEEIANTFRRRKIPCDVIYLDIHYMDGYRVFTFGKTFPKPRQLIDRLAKQGFKVVTIVDPGVKDNRQFPVLKRGMERRAFVKADDGHSDYRGHVWPGQVRFPDFLSARAREWWGEEQARFQNLGIAGFWNDMNEPADFSAPQKDFPANCVHQTEFGPLRHATVHNVYGSQMARASYEGALRHRPNQRPFVITRAGYAGLQRHALVWTGDNDSSWEHLADSVQMLLNLSLSGVAFCGADVGGFHHHTTGELLARWMQLAAFTPFFRNHSNIRTIDQEPWAFGPEVEAICRTYIELRYQLLPYLYGLFVQAHRHGTPIMRPLFWHYQNDPLAVAAGDQFMLGPDLIVAPILRQGATARSVYLPSGIWFNFWTSEPIRGGQHILAEADLGVLPVFARAGGIVPLVPTQQFVGQKESDVVNLHLWPGRDGELHWYEDDGQSLDFEQGAFYERRITLTARKTTSILKFEPAKGTFRTKVRTWRIVLRSVVRPVRARINGQNFTPPFVPELALAGFELKNQSGAFEVEWR